MPEKLPNVAEEVYLEYGHDPPALKTLIKKIKDDKELLTEALQFAAEEALRAAQRSIRHQIELNEQSAREMPRVYSQREQEGTLAAYHGWFDWPLMDGTKLGNATKEMLAKDAQRYRANARGSQVKAEFEELVAAKLTVSQKVRDVLSPQQLAGLMQKAISKVDKKGGGTGKKLG